MECLLLVVVVRLLKEGRLEAAARVLCWGDERVGGGGYGGGGIGEVKIGQDQEKEEMSGTG